MKALWPVQVTGVQASAAEFGISGWIFLRALLGGRLSCRGSPGEPRVDAGTEGARVFGGVDEDQLVRRGGVVRGAQQEVVVHWYWPPRMPVMRVDPLG